jgi:hypothetical protein
LEKSYKKILLILLVLLIPSCIQPYRPPVSNYDIVKSSAINKTFNEVWTKIISWFAENNIPIRILNKESGYISTYSESIADYKLSIADCGNPSDYNFLCDIHTSFNIVVEKISDNTTKITINIMFTGWECSSQNDIIKKLTKLNCLSTGVLEKEILNYIDK